MNRSFKSKKLFIIIGGVIAAVIFGGVGTLLYLRRTSPESLLYKTLAQATSEQTITSEKINGDDTKASFEGITAKDGTFKGAGSFECLGSSSLGETRLKISMRQIQQQIFFQYNDVYFSGGDDEALNQELNNQYKNTIINKWVLMSRPDEAALGYQQKGVDFNLLGATSKTMSAKEVADKLKQNNVITIEGTREIKNGTEAAIEYTLVVRRSAYKRFMKSVEPQFKYTDEILDQLFTGDTEEITLVINKADESVDHATYDDQNICSLLMGEFDPDAAANMRTTVEIEATNPSKPSANVKNLTKPTEHISEEEFNKILSE